ncbi:MAG: acyl-CoA dehydrogenase [Oceanococcaceae bacterium]
MFWFISLLIIAVALAFLRASLVRTFTVLGVWLVLTTLFGEPGWFGGMTLWLIYGAAAAVLLREDLRSRFLVGPAFNAMRDMLPTISDTERAALEAGSVSWDGDLFSGTPDLGKLFVMPMPKLSAREKQFLDGPVEEFVGQLDGWTVSQTDADIPAASWDFLKKNKFFGMIIPEQYGGLGFSALAHSEVLARIGSHPAGTVASSIVAVPNSLGPAELLLHYGTDEQKNHYLPRLAVGQEIPCFALTSPWAGSDAASIPDTGIVCKGQWEGKEVLGMRLTWDKRYITLAPVATVLGLAVKLRDPQHLLGNGEDIGITCCLIPTSTPGVEIGRRHWPIAAPFMNGPTSGTDVFVPLDYIIGGPKQAGRGWTMLMECLSVGRAISLPSGSTGAINGLTRLTGAYAAVREQFGLPIGQFEGVGEALARIGTRCYAANAVRWMTASLVDMGERPSVPSAIAKFSCTHMCQQAAIDSMDIHAGKAVMVGPSNPIAGVYMASPVSITVEGANILTRSLMIFGQGAMRCHPHVRAEIEAIADGAQERFGNALLQHIGHVGTAKTRSLVLGLLPMLAPLPERGAVHRHEMRQLCRYSANLAFLTEICFVVLGGKLKFAEGISGRMADVFSQLYIVSCAMKRFEDDGRPPDDLPLLRGVCQMAFRIIEDALDGVLRNLPGRLIPLAARLIIFPLGRRAGGIDDNTSKAVADLLLEPGPARDRLTASCFTPRDDSAVAVFDKAMVAQIETSGLRARIAKALRAGQVNEAPPAELITQAIDANIVSQEDGLRLREAQTLIDALIRVDDFAPTALASAPPPTSKAAPRKTASRTRSKAGSGESTAKTTRPAKAPRKPAAKPAATRRKTDNKE